MKRPFEIAFGMCDDIISKYEADKLPGLPDRFHYIQAIFLFAIERCYKICKEKRYFDYIKSWADCRIDKNGVILNQHDLLDDMMPAVLLINLYKETGDERYKTALDSTIERLRSWKCNEYGGFYHMYKTPNQVWLDGLFMAGELLTEYAKEFNVPEFFDVMSLQSEIMYEHIRKRDTGLYYHAWDPSKQAEWADSETGLSAECWGRAMGWVAFALCDMLERFPRAHKAYNNMNKQLCELLEALMKYQDRESGLWYQVTDKSERNDNWTETSCSCLFAYAFHKAVRLGLVEGEAYAATAQRAYDGIMGCTHTDENGKLIIPNICVGTNVTDYQGYVSRPRRDNDNHGTGAFILMCCEFSL
ncbi:MAG: glycoside hydrolase family 88 protein [Clostridia bacterium]|nr:glycoside hydrolase family 88 protein [Clostridia bacterium]